MVTNHKVKLLLTTAVVAVAYAAGTSAATAQNYGIRHTSSETLTVDNPAGQTIEGAKSGIFGQEGPVAVTNAGTIIGRGTYDGFAAEPDSGVVFAAEDSSVVNSGTITGAGTGVGTANYYNPATDSLEPRAVGTTVANSGTITGQNNDGVRLIGGGTVTNSGTIQGLTGTFTDGISMFALVGQNTIDQASIGTVVNQAGGTITGPRFGIILSGGGVVENAGTIGGDAGAILIQSVAGETGKTAIITNSGSLTGGDAVSIAGTITSASVTNSGTIEGSGAYGIHNSSTGTVTVTNLADGVIEGAKSGIFGQEGPVAVINAGTIIGHGSYDGFDAEPDSGIVFATEGSSVVNSGTITGAGTGVGTANYYNAATDSLQPRAVGTIVTNSGTITGETNDGVRLIGGGTVTNSGTIQGLTGTFTDGISMFALVGQNTTDRGSIGTVTNDATGTISGPRFGIILSGGGVVENAGAIDGGAGAILIQSVAGETGKNAIITNSGSLTGGDAISIAGTINTATVTNSGTIEGSGAYGIHNSAVGAVTVTNLAGGVIEGAKSGIFGQEGAVIVNNAGTIIGHGSYDGFDAEPDSGIVFATEGSSVVNSGTITGAGTGVGTANYFNAATNSLQPRAVDTTVTNSGTITGETNDGVRLIGGGTVTNSGTIQGLAGAGTDGISMFALVGQDTTGQASIGTVANQAGGTISGQRFGIILSGGGVIDNAGTIGGEAGAVFIQSTAGQTGKTATITNSGALNGDVGIAGTIASAALTNSGAITGTVSLSLGGDTLDNAGRIDGDVFLDAGDDALVLRNGSTVTGLVDGGVGTDSVTLRGISATATQAQTVAAVANFETLEVAQGYWTADKPVGAFGSVSIGANGILAIREVVTEAGSDGPIATANIINNGLLVLDFDNSETVTNFDAIAISGTGGVRLEGEAIFEVDSGDLTYTGLTTIANGGVVLTGTIGGDVATNGDGVFQLGDGGITGDFTGDLVNDGLFVFNRSDDYDFLGAFSGTGDFAKMGGGTLTFAGDYSYTGTTRILGGAVKFAGAIDPTTEIDLASGSLDVSGTPQTIAMLAGQSGTSVVIDNSTLTIDQASNSAYAGTISGDGSLVKEGDGRLNLTGASDYSGPTEINGGTLSVNGSIVSNVTVNAGARLGGIGTVADVTVAASGTFAPGNSIGTIAVAGDVAFAAGSFYQVEVDATGAADRINATGQATLAAGSGVQVLAAAGTYSPRTDYVILTAQGGVTGTFSTVTSDMAFLTPTLAYTANSVSLRLYRNDIAFADAATSFNQASAGAAVQALGIGNTLYEDALVQNAAGAQAAFDALSGEIHASLGSALTNDSRHVRDALLATNSADEGMRLWGSATGSWGEADARDGVAKLDADQRGLITGFDYAGGAFTAGIAAGISNADYDVDARASIADVDSQFVGGHLGYKAGAFGAMIGGALAWHDVDTRRNVNFASIAQTLTASYDATTRQVFGEVSYGFAYGGASLTPFARLAHIRTKTDGFAEGTGSAALTVAGDVQKVQLLTLGIDARGKADATFQPRATLGWQHGWGDLDGTSNARFASSTGDFAILGSRLPRDAATIDGGFDLHFGAVTIGAGYLGSLAKHWSDHGAKATFSLKF